jgi:hypothetical protein
MRSAGISDSFGHKQKSASGIAIAHGSHAATGVAAMAHASHTANSLSRRMDILPESPVVSIVPLWKSCRPPRRQLLKPDP